MTTISEALSLAVQQHQAGRLEQAEQLYRQILATEPRHPHCWHLLGVLAHQQGDHATAIERISQAIEIKADNAAYHSNLGLIYQALDRLDDAVAAFHRSAQLNADFFEAHFNLGNVLRIQGYDEQALASYRQALRLRPDYAEVYHNMGTIFLNRGRLEEAQAQFHEAIRLKPGVAEAHNGLGVVLMQEKKLEEAAIRLRDAIRLKPELAEAYNNLGVVLMDQGLVEEAEVACREAVRLKPEYAEGHNSLGTALQEQARLGEALACYERAIALQSDYRGAHFNRAYAWLLTGDWKRGWPEYEWRYGAGGLTPRAFEQPRWDGSPLAGRTLLLHAEQGLGDTIQFARYASLARQQGGKVILECQPPLVGLLSDCPGVDEVIAQGQPLPSFDVQAPLLSMPALMGTVLETVPSQVPYLRIDARRATAWSRELEPADTLKVGITWHGDPRHMGDRFRSIPLEFFARLATVPGVQLYSLQKGPGQETSASLSEPWTIIDLAPRLDDFRDTAAVMNSLDLTISCDTAAAHLAGALGLPVWLALPFAPDWRWLQDREDTPWYPSMRLFRQRRAGDWADVFDRIESSLRELANRRRDSWAPAVGNSEPAECSAQTLAALSTRCQTFA